ncbi:MAG TPA: cysteine--tRNA ligase, partial [Candidatus Paceibacterota bacterium]|nr:cysteine--tRNA ligase [Candidatus Paceibacterota bacterium]
HENEIAQSEGATGKSFVKYWLHNEWVMVEGKKMAKSAGNFYTLRDVVAKGVSPLTYRFWLLMASYRSPVNFVWEALEGSGTALKRLYNLYTALGRKTGRVSQEYRQKFKGYLEDDLDTPRAVALLWDLLKDEKVTDADKRATMLDFDRVLGLGFSDLKQEKIPEEILKLVKEREEARKNKDFKKSDELRDKMSTLGWEVKDTEEGQKLNKV